MCKTSLNVYAEVTHIYERHDFRMGKWTYEYMKWINVNVIWIFFYSENQRDGQINIYDLCKHLTELVGLLPLFKLVKWFILMTVKDLAEQVCLHYLAAQAVATSLNWWRWIQISKIFFNSFWWNVKGKCSRKMVQPASIMHLNAK